MGKRLMAQESDARISLEAVNAMSVSSFVDLLSGVFENSPHLTARLWHLRPFESVEDMQEALWEVIHSLPNKERLDLIRRHPGPEGKTGFITPQPAGAGQGRGVKAAIGNLRLLERLSADYRRKFSFPFITGPESGLKEALEALQQRLQHPREEEVSAALTEICETAGRQLALRITA